MKRSFYNAKASIKNHFFSQARWYFLLLFVTIAGVALGSYLCASGKAEVNIFEKNNSASLFDFVSGNTNSFSLFFSYFLRVLLSVVVIVFLSILPYILPLSFVYFAYQGYILGISATSLIILSGFSGAINTLFFFLPINLLSFTTLFIVEVGLIKRLSEKKKLRLRFLE